MTLEQEFGQINPVHRLDERALAEYLRGRLDGFNAELSIGKFKHGQSNPTFLLSSGGKSYVLRKKPPGRLLPSAHAVDREYRILKALTTTDVPVPEPFLLCEDASIIGTAFYVMEFVEGRVFRDPIAHEVSDAEERTALFEAMNETLAKIHLVDWEGLGLSDYGRPGNYMARQVSRWAKQYEASKTDDIESMNELIQWLEENIPDDDSTSIVHGDFRLENLIIHSTQPRVVAVLDWELSTLGHPLADLAYNCMEYYLPATGIGRPGHSGLNLGTLGIPREKDYVAAYCRRTGRKGSSDWEFFLAFGMFRLAAILQGVYRRGLDGIASADNAKTYRTQVQFLSETAREIVCPGNISSSLT